jgi:guanosine-3',5'-bis(diphosphate) 3'-pyrophosphohydrolase
MQEKLDKLIKAIRISGIKCDIEKIKKAFYMANEYHDNQIRSSGEPYIDHPYNVALILVELEMDCDSLIAALLHDTLEDTSINPTVIIENFGDEVYKLIDGVTNIGKISYTNRFDRQVESFRKMLLAMSKDLRVIIIKLADRLHNMRTLMYLPEEKQKEKAKETLELFAPLSHRLGMFKMKWELEDLSFKYLDPVGYNDLVSKIIQKRKEREDYINDIREEFEINIKKGKIRNYKIEGRPKHFYSIYRKMVGQNKPLEQIYDLLALRVIVSTERDCYSVLAIAHDMYKAVPGRFKDYISTPKTNMYQSLHTVVIGPKGIAFEIQIRTFDMHRIAEFGYAAHWKYKEGDKRISVLDNKLAWLRQLLEWQQEVRDSSEFMENLKIDLIPEEVFAFTPKGDLINLPMGSTPIDFAYAIHSGVGNRMIGAKVNGSIVPLGYELKNGDIVSIITSSSTRGPSRDWLNTVKSSQAKSKIKQWFKKENKEENIEKGKESIERELKRQALDSTKLLKGDFVKIVLQRYNFNTLEDIFSAIGYGGITAQKIVSRLKEEHKKTLKPDEIEKGIVEVQKKNRNRAKSKPEAGIEVKGIDNCLVRLSKCCNPVPGDSIMGYITRGRGVSVHKSDCKILDGYKGDEERLIDVNWHSASNMSYNVELLVKAYDRSGLTADITTLIGKLKIALQAVNARGENDGTATIFLTLDITDLEQLEIVIKNIRNIPSVYKVERKTGG